MNDNDTGGYGDNNSNGPRVLSEACINATIDFYENNTQVLDAEKQVQDDVAGAFSENDCRVNDNTVTCTFDYNVVPSVATYKTECEDGTYTTTTTTAVEAKAKSRDQPTVTSHAESNQALNLLLAFLFSLPVFASFHLKTIAGGKFHSMPTALGLQCMVEGYEAFIDFVNTPACLASICTDEEIGSIRETSSTTSTPPFPNGGCSARSAKVRLAVPPTAILLAEAITTAPLQVP